MNNSPSVNKLAEDAQELSRDEIMLLMARLAAIAEHKEQEITDAGEPEKKHSILEFRGIAKHLATDEDPQDYVNRLRSEWDHRP